MNVPHVTAFGTKYAVIKPLGDDWYLVGHPAGPAITTTKYGFLGIISRPCEEVPETIRIKAIDAYVEHSWPQVRATVIPVEHVPNSGTSVPSAPSC
jgi:hypothetical protein